MSTRSQWLARFMIGAMIFALCGVPELMQAQASSPQTSTPQSATPDPSRGPQQPTPGEPGASLPEAPSATTPSPQPTATSNTHTSYNEITSGSSQAQAPTGAAAAQRAETAGGAASRPAGNAIAPAKQRQTRSILIKVGAVAAAGAAAGLIYGLSRGTGSLPPGARTTANASAGH